MQPTDLRLNPPLQRVGVLERTAFDGILQKWRDRAQQMLAARPQHPQ